MNTLRSLRLLPIVLFATGALLGLKVLGLLTGGSYAPSGPADAMAQSAAAPATQPIDANATPLPLAQSGQPRGSWAQQMFGYPDITGSVSNSKAPAAPAAAPPPAPTPTLPGRGATRPLEGRPVTLEEKDQTGPGDRAVLERLQERRQELENRARELDIREGLLKAAEKRLEARIEELRALEQQLAAGTQKKDEAEAARFKGLVSMYENMKAKEAARIFDRLDLRVLLDVASQIAPRRMSEILAQMTPEAAERLTVELAARANSNNGRAPSANELPKIEGRPRS